ncbi:MAG: hypothetical protein CMH27_06205 [Micavibrio sp.]|nr:hypothetical protein [Micavibrio sp.]|tara:strand:+ start:8302 stop:9390 length:1089 start_codon:yes stop_codon:yes gene_type:complete
MHNIFTRSATNDYPQCGSMGTPRIFLALQGGGSHGAFTAGVLQALGEHNLLKHVTGISGTSAGAFNAAPLSYALNIGRPELAPQLINNAWDRVAKDSRSLSLMHSFARASAHINPFLSPARYPNLPRQYVDQLKDSGHLASALRLGSQSGDIKKRINAAVPDWDVIKNGPIRTVIAATEMGRENNMPVMREKLFYNTEIDARAIAASAALIGTHRINGIKYKDGGYTNNPPLQDAAQGDYTDILAIMLSKMPTAPLTPQTQAEHHRAHKFLHAEVYSELALIRQTNHKNLHVIAMEHEDHWDETSKMNSEEKWINDLHNRGLEAGRRWIRQHAHNLGIASTYNPVIDSVRDCHLDKPAHIVA